MEDVRRLLASVTEDEIRRLLASIMEDDLRHLLTLPPVTSLTAGDEPELGISQDLVSFLYLFKGLCIIIWTYL